MRTRTVLTAVLLASLALSVPPAGADPKPYTTTHVVKRGDTLIAIARWYGTTVRDLKARNELRGNTVVVGRALRVPLGGSAAAGPRLELKPIVQRSATYVVQRGDTLGGLARLAGLEVRELRNLNGLGRGPLRVGQRLRLTTATASLPACPVRGASRFDISDSYGSLRHGGRRHRGNDIFARRGTPVVAPVAGTLRVASGAVAGHAFYLDGDDGTTYYGAHLQALTARGRVDAEAVIGSVGNSGNAAGTPPHLHFEIRPAGGGPVDPNRALRSWCR